MIRPPLALTIALVGSVLLSPVTTQARTTAALPSPARYRAHIPTTHSITNGVYVRTHTRVDYDYTIVWPGQQSFPDSYTVATGTAGNSRFINTQQALLSDVPHPTTQGPAWLGQDRFGGHCRIWAGAFQGHTSFEVVATSEQRGACAPALAHAQRDFAAVAPLIGLCQPSALLRFAGCARSRQARVR